MIQYNWKINRLDLIPDNEGKLNYVTNINWTYFATDENFEASSSGNLGLSQTFDSPNYVPYEQLTEEDVINWLELTLNVTEMQNALNIELNKLINPPIVNLPLPWVK
jgi:hypothetical protein